MSRLNDLKEQFKSQIAPLWEKIQQSPAFNQIKDRYENLSTGSQKMVVLGITTIIILLLASLPLQFLLSASDEVASFEGQRDLIHDLFKIQQDSQSSTGLSSGPSQSSLQSQIEGELKNAQLAPEQLRGVQNAMGNITGLPKEFVESAVQVSLAKLNLRQVIDVGYQILNIHPTLKMVDLNMEPNNQDPRYFDVTYKIAALKVPEFLPQLPMEEEKPNKNNKKGFGTIKKDGDE
jgi:hypothetical protein